jgi:hypothetical protein
VSESKENKKSTNQENKDNQNYGAENIQVLE